MPFQKAGNRLARQDRIEQKRGSADRGAGEKALQKLRTAVGQDGDRAGPFQRAAKLRGETENSARGGGHR